ncbi:MAG: hypothetical protein RSD54_02270 [Ruthenibacterium sp.]
MKILFCKANRKYRKPFQLSTLIFKKEDGQYGVCKRALSSEAKAHLTNMLQARDRLAACFSNLTLCPAKWQNDVLEFDYISGEPLEGKFLCALQKSSKDEFFYWIDFYDKCFETAEKNQCKFEQTEAFTRIFGEQPELIGMDAFCYSTQEITWNNLLLQKDEKPVLIDYEWCFDFPMPVEYLKMRGIYRMYLNVPQFEEFVPIAKVFQHLQYQMTIAQCKKMEDAFFHYITVEPETQLNYCAAKDGYLKEAVNVSQAVQLFQTVQNTGGLYTQNLEQTNEILRNHAAELEAANTSLSNHAAELEAANTSLSNHVAELEAELEAANTSLSGHVMELEQARETLDTHTKTLTREMENLRMQCENVQKENERIVAEQNRFKASLSSLKNRLKFLFDNDKNFKK